MEIEQEKDKYQHEILAYLRHRVMPILQPLQLDILSQKPTNVSEFSYFWLQNFSKSLIHTEQQKLRPSFASSDDQEGKKPSKVCERKFRRDRGRLGFSGQIYSSIQTRQQNKSYWDKCEQDKIKILVKLREHIFFKNLSQANIQEIIKCMKSINFKPGDLVIREGDVGNELYLVESGYFKCTIKQKKKDPTFYGPGEAFGELALLYNTRRASTITCQKDGKLFILDRASFNSILRDNVLKKTRMCEQILQKTQFFSTIKPYEKCKLIQSLKQISYPAGKYVIKQGQIGDKFYIVGEGKLVAQKIDEEGEFKPVFYLKEGDYFGEIALIKNIPRQASVKTLTSTKLLFIDRNTFKRLLGPLQQLLRRNQDRYKSIKQSIRKNVI